MLRKLQCWTQVFCGYIGIIDKSQKCQGIISSLPHYYYDNQNTSCFLPLILLSFHLENSCKFCTMVSVYMSAIISYLFILSLWWCFNVTIYVRSFQLTSLQWENWPNSPLVKRLLKFRTIFILGHCWKHIERPDMRLPDRSIEPFR